MTGRVKVRSAGALMFAAAVVLVGAMPATAQISVEELCTVVAEEAGTGAVASPGVESAASPGMEAMASPGVDAAASPDMAAMATPAEQDGDGMSQVTAELLLELCTRAGLGAASPDAAASALPMASPATSPAADASPAA